MNGSVLLVEDEYLLSEATRQDLEDLGLQVVCAGDCDSGWEALNADPAIEVLITDIRTPGQLDGWELARRARDLRPQLSVIYVSGYSADEPQPVPDSVFLKKPYWFAQLREALEGFGVATRPTG